MFINHDVANYRNKKTLRHFIASIAKKKQKHARNATCVCERNRRNSDQTSHHVPMGAATAALGSAKAIWPAKLTPAKKAAPVPATRRAASSKVSFDLASSAVLAFRAVPLGRCEGAKASTPNPERARKAVKARDLVIVAAFLTDPLEEKGESDVGTSERADD